MAIVTPMRKSDLAAVARLAGELGYPSSTGQVERRFAEIRANPDHMVFVARLTSDGEPVGWVHLQKQVSLASDARAEVSGLIVSSAHRGKGIGTELLAEAERWAQSQELPLLRFTSNISRNDAHRLYLRLGYEIRKTSFVFAKPIASP